MGLSPWLGALNPVAAIANVGVIGADLWSASEDRKSQEKINREQIAYWREQAEYNKPINQMARLKEAGLSPHLAYGQIADAKMGSAPQLLAPQYGRNPLSKMGEFLSLQNVMMQNKLYQEQLRGAVLQNDYAEYENDVYKARGMVKNDPVMYRLGIRGGEWASDFFKRIGDWSLETIKEPIPFRAKWFEDEVARQKGLWYDKRNRRTN